MESTSETPPPSVRPPEEAAPQQRSLAQRIERRPGLFLFLVTILYVLGSLCAASRKPYFFDEIMTAFLADLPDVRQIWSLIARGMELNPPLPFWIAWAVRHTLGDGEIISRLPAIAGFWIMCFSLYHFVRRRCGAIWGFVAFLLPLFTYPATESAIARGYGMMLGASGLALLSWQLASDRVRRPLTLVALAAAIAIAVSCHYYAAYVAGAIAFGELIRTRDSGKFEPGVWLALAAGLTPLIAYAELVRAAAAGASEHFWISPLPLFLYQSYADLAGPTAIVSILLLVLLLLPAREGEANQAGMDEPRWAAPTIGRHELAVCFALAAMPLVIYLAGVFAHVPFFTRYVEPVTIGYSVILAFFAHRIGGHSPRFQRLTISLLVWFCLVPWTLWQMVKVKVARPPSAYMETHQPLPLDSPLPILFDSEADFLEFYYYGTPELRARIYNPIDIPAAIRFRGFDTGLRSLLVAQSFRDIHAVDYHEFLASHHEFLVARMRDEGWVVQALLADGARMSVVSLTKPLGVYVQATTVYHVVMPGGDH
jgi:hypothetical protein